MTETDETTYHQVPPLGEQLLISLIAIVVAPIFLILAIIILDTLSCLLGLPNNHILFSIIDAIFN